MIERKPSKWEEWYQCTECGGLHDLPFTACVHCGALDQYLKAHHISRRFVYEPVTLAQLIIDFLWRHKRGKWEVRRQ